ncbi:protein turtle homolog A [Tachyglossus aculeatus]|uniref:protein turtle homolog A n=1 Tax=Tachyglossus aculeatus TaxID=9261 RepID=UPI0018F536CD|nr:protein turtle homolog A [Tachyglossus aculeatus]
MIWFLFLATLSLFTCQGANGDSAAVAVVGRAGQSALLTCDLLPPSGRPPLHVIEWQRFGFLLPIFIQFGLYSPRVDPQYLGRVQLQGGASLRIDGLRAEDQGWYECRVLFLDRPGPEDDFRNGSWVHLAVRSPPRFQETPPSVLEAREQEPLSLSCTAGGSPQPRIVWKHDGHDRKAMGSGQVQNGTLRIDRLERGHAGLYTCEASSPEGTAIHTTRLLVLGPPVIVGPPENSTVNATQDALLACRAQAYPANLTYNWFQGDTNVFHISRLQSRVRVLVDGSLRLQAAQPDDAGRYTCVPSNGLPHPPSASAFLTVLCETPKTTTLQGDARLPGTSPFRPEYNHHSFFSHPPPPDPAQVTEMPAETPLPTGMRGVIRCPFRANPPQLFVHWTKDGQALQLDKVPGWSQAADGSVVVAVANEDAEGEYTCTPYNSHGTTGPSPPTRVQLKRVQRKRDEVGGDEEFERAPPALVVLPKDEYFQEVGRELVIPCVAQGDPLPTITWTKEGPRPRSEAQVDVNGSLVLRPLTKEAHGRWECSAVNAVASVAAGTTVYVLGTSPHVATNISVQPLPTGVNVSWEPGFDGGYLQRFSVWYTPLPKRPDRAHHGWLSLPVPLGVAHLLVPNLQPHASYQFSVLAQNKLGSGPFSEIVSSSPAGLRTTPAAPSAPPHLPLSPPRALTAAGTARGVMLSWEPPLLAPGGLASYALEGRHYALEGKHGPGGWEVLNRDIGGTDTRLVVPALIKDSFYEFRLVAFAGSYVSDPSNTANISTAGLEVYPSRTQLSGLLPEPVLAGLVGGLAFLGAAVLLSSIAAACCVNRRRRRAARHKRRRDPPLVFSPLRKSPPHSAAGSGSPDSLLKLQLRPSPPPSPHGSPPPGPDLEPISRGPDGRFVVGRVVATLPPPARRPGSPFATSSSPAALPGAGAAEEAMVRPLCIVDISPVGSPAPAPSPPPSALLHYLSLPFFREMNVDGDEPPGPIPPPDYMDTRPPDPPPRPPQPQASPRPLRASLTSQSSGRGSASFLRPPSLVPSSGGSYPSPPAPEDTASWASWTSWASWGGGPEARPAKEHVVTVSKRRNTSVDENYEWDPQGPEETELLEALRMVRGGGGRPRPGSSAALQDRSHAPLSPSSPLLAGSKVSESGQRPDRARWAETLGISAGARSGPEARCAALREEFLAFRRRRDAARARLPSRREPTAAAPCPDQPRPGPALAPPLPSHPDPFKTRGPECNAPLHCRAPAPDIALAPAPPDARQGRTTRSSPNPLSLSEAGLGAGDSPLRGRHVGWGWPGGRVGRGIRGQAVGGSVVTEELRISWASPNPPVPETEHHHFLQ